jgi:carbonic anhydrase/acetyltransferase-like protein (isoleucine patch superfamily)
MSPVILPYRGIAPRIAASAFVAPGVVLIGDVAIGEHASIWYGCILRGDLAPITVGANTNLQDGTVVHVRGGAHSAGTRIGANVTVGHMALIHACTLEDGSFVAMKACVCDDVVVESGAMVAAGAVVTPRKRVPAGQLWGGNPARFMREMNDRERQQLVSLPPHYASLAEEHKNLSL